VNYIKEINTFYDWLETNPVSDSSIVLWHALMNINNKCGWKVEFAVAISSIQNKTGLSKSSILRARNILQQAGRINFKSRTGQQSSMYSLIAFHTDTQSGTQSGTQSDTQTVTQTDTILKLNETKQEFKKINAHEGHLSKSEIENTIEFLDRIKQKKLSEENVINFWEAFLLNAQETAYYSRAKKIQHFRNWLKNQSHGNGINQISAKSHRDKQADSNERLLAKLRAVTGAG
jgi:hypothetical protein